ncbi:hypothetical protein AO398_00050 [Methylobacterium sp. GXS13]|uniref:hypothetical protein n=1 Tax=Methylobacterium sp. GXS13 TaxID=1730094 RepID=UPI00071B5B1E|nr:hypothetical protein [Methylobacterium sp. GXS13]KST61118.1 hypothetical protein AO398_00050 [Methylobacterium sp. GXS13]
MIYDEFYAVARHALKNHAGADGLQITAITPSAVGPVVHWTAPLLARERQRKAMGVVGVVAGPVILDLLVRTLAARWRRGAPYCPQDWDQQLSVRYRRVFGRQTPATGPGWSWLWEGGAQAIVASGVPRNFKTTDMKEKYGAARWYHQAEEDCEYVDDIIDAVEHLSGFICEDCGKPGKIRRGSWIRCLCELHAKGRPGS